MGNGKIISKGKIAYSKGVNNNNFLNISGDDLTIEISDRTTSSYAKGLFYAGDDFLIQPMAFGSLLRMGGGDPNTQTRNVQNYYPGTGLGNPSPSTVIGYYDDPGTRPAGLDAWKPWPPDGYQCYKGNRMRVRRVEISGGDHKLLVEGLPGDIDDHISICLGNRNCPDYPPTPGYKNVDFGNYQIGLYTIGGGGYDVKLITIDGSGHDHVVPNQASVS